MWLRMLWCAVGVGVDGIQQRVTLLEMCLLGTCPRLLAQGPGLRALRAMPWAAQTLCDPAT